MTRDELEVWKNQRETKEVMELIGAEIDSLVESLSTGGTLSDSAETTAIYTAVAVGRIKGLRKLVELEFEGEEE